jgi:murein DD-endopeptidase MepM/ murein hydrolase activator NlpD
MLVALSHHHGDSTPLSLDQDRLLDDWVDGRLSSIDANRAAELAKHNVFAAERVLERRLISAANEGPGVPDTLAGRVLRRSQPPETKTVRIFKWPMFSGWQWSGVGALAAATVAIAVFGFQFWQQPSRMASDDSSQSGQVGGTSIMLKSAAPPPGTISRSPDAVAVLADALSPATRKPQELRPEQSFQIAMVTLEDRSVLAGGVRRTRGPQVPLAPSGAKVVPVAPALANPTMQSIKPTEQPAASARIAAPTAEATADDAGPAAATGMPSFRWPLRGRVTTNFGAKTAGGSSDGIDLAVPEGNAVRAADDGVVAYAGNELKGYGNLVLIRHANGFVTAYANASEINVKRNDQVHRGQVIAKSGQTGSAATPQLHFEIRKDLVPVDPTQYWVTRCSTWVRSLSKAAFKISIYQPRCFGARLLALPITKGRSNIPS